MWELWRQLRNVCKDWPDPLRGPDGGYESERVPAGPVDSVAAVVNVGSPAGVALSTAGGEGSARHHLVTNLNTQSDTTGTSGWKPLIVPSRYCALIGCDHSVANASSFMPKRHSSRHPNPPTWGISCLSLCLYGIRVAFFLHAGKGSVIEQHTTILCRTSPISSH